MSNTCSAVTQHVNMVYDYTKQRIVLYSNIGLTACRITKELRQEGYRTTRQGVAKFLKWYRSRGSIARKPGSCCLTKITQEALSIVEEAMTLNDETTAVQIHYILRERGIEISLRTVLHS